MRACFVKMKMMVVDVMIFENVLNMNESLCG